MSTDLDPHRDALDRWLRANLPGFDGLLHIAKFGDGQSNPTFALESRARRYVLRAKPLGPLLKSAHQVGREYRVMAALEGSDVPVPAMLALAPDNASPLGRAFFVMEHLEGRIFWDPALPELERADRVSVYDEMNRVLAALHEVDPAAVGLSDFGKPANYLQRQVEVWSRQYRASASTPLPGMAHLMSWLPRHAPGDDGQVALIHGDYRLDNAIFDPLSPRMIGLLDWELATLGHPFADLAYQCMQWRLPHDGPMRGLGGLDRAALGLPDEEAYVAAYCERRGIGAIDDWPYYIVFSCFRLAAILQGVAARADAGNASNPKTARRYAAAVPMLVEMGVEVAEQGA